ncbi:MAG: glutamate 5-kinase, partial [Actinomycetota bacterium]
FVSGDTVEVVGPGGATFARGRVAVDAAGLRAVLGRHTGDLPAGMVHEVIHRDHLVVLDL